MTLVWVDEKVSVCCTKVEVVVDVKVVLMSVVPGAGVIVVTGVDVDLTTALLVKVNAMLAVGTGLFELFPSKVVQACSVLVESANASCAGSRQSAAKGQRDSILSRFLV